MVGALAELISYQIDDAVKKLQSVSRRKISPGAISSLYVLLGCLLLIFIPSYIFTQVEGKLLTFKSVGTLEIIPKNLRGYATLICN
jgi:hypothetical protein